MADLTGRVVVKLLNNVQVPYQDAAEQQLEQASVDAWNALENAFGITISLDRALPEFDPAAIQDLADQANSTLTRFFAVSVPAGVEATDLADAIAALPFVESAYAETQTTLPAPPSQTPNDPEFANETQLQPAAQLGVDALASWLETRGDGEGVRLVDIEEDWDLAHRDLPPVTVGGGQRQGAIDHGTSVLGIIIAIPENATDCIGIAPAVNVEAVPITRASGVIDSQSAFIAAVLDLIPVDPAGATPIILIEQQSGAFGPVEMEALWPQMIAAATNLGIAVVEPAGNGSVDLDQFSPPLNTPNPFSRSTFDSGAILVAACGGPSSSPSLAPASFTSHGTRVDCFAQGADVVTLSAGANPVTRQFGGTSSASAIVAAVACCVSAMHTDTFGAAIAPIDLRALLSDSSVNTPSNSPAVDLIGVMPDLGAIIRHGV
jgi:hypothetical protein